MNVVATNVRFPVDEYADLKRLAFLSKKSIASVIREAVTHYKSEASKAGQAKKMALYDSIVESAVQIDVPVLDLVKEGRKFE